MEPETEDDNRSAGQDHTQNGENNEHDPESHNNIHPSEAVENDTHKQDSQPDLKGDHQNGSQAPTNQNHKHGVAKSQDELSSHSRQQQHQNNSSSNNHLNRKVQSQNQLSRPASARVQKAPSHEKATESNHEVSAANAAPPTSSHPALVRKSSLKKIEDPHVDEGQRKLSHSALDDGLEGDHNASHSHLHAHFQDEVPKESDDQVVKVDSRTIQPNDTDASQSNNEEKHQESRTEDQFPEQTEVKNTENIGIELQSQAQEEVVQNSSRHSLKEDSVQQHHEEIVNSDPVEEHHKPLEPPVAQGTANRSRHSINSSQPNLFSSNNDGISSPIRHYGSQPVLYKSNEPGAVARSPSTSRGNIKDTIQRALSTSKSIINTSKTVLDQVIRNDVVVTSPKQSHSSISKLEPTSPEITITEKPADDQQEDQNVAPETERPSLNSNSIPSGSSKKSSVSFGNEALVRVIPGISEKNTEFGSFGGGVITYSPSNVSREEAAGFASNLIDSLIRRASKSADDAMKDEQEEADTVENTTKVIQMYDEEERVQDQQHQEKEKEENKEMPPEKVASSHDIVEPEKNFDESFENDNVQEKVTHETAGSNEFYQAEQKQQSEVAKVPEESAQVDSAEQTAVPNEAENQKVIITNEVIQAKNIDPSPAASESNAFFTPIAETINHEKEGEEKTGSIGGDPVDSYYRQADEISTSNGEAQNATSSSTGVVPLEVNADVNHSVSSRTLFNNQTTTNNSNTNFIAQRDLSFPEINDNKLNSERDLMSIQSDPLGGKTLTNNSYHDNNDIASSERDDKTSNRNQKASNNDDNSSTIPLYGSMQNNGSGNYNSTQMNTPAIYTGSRSDVSLYDMSLEEARSNQSVISFQMDRRRNNSNYSSSARGSNVNPENIMMPNDNDSISSNNNLEVAGSAGNLQSGGSNSVKSHSVSAVGSVPGGLSGALGGSGFLGSSLGSGGVAKPQHARAKSNASSINTNFQKEIFQRNAANLTSEQLHQVVGSIAASDNTDNGSNVSVLRSDDEENLNTLSSGPPVRLEEEGNSSTQTFHNHNNDNHQDRNDQEEEQREQEDLETRKGDKYHLGKSYSSDLNQNTSDNLGASLLQAADNSKNGQEAEAASNSYSNGKEHSEENNYDININPFAPEEQQVNYTASQQQSQLQSNSNSNPRVLAERDLIGSLKELSFLQEEDEKEKDKFKLMDFTNPLGADSRAVALTSSSAGPESNNNNHNNAVADNNAVAKKSSKKEGEKEGDKKEEEEKKDEGNLAERTREKFPLPPKTLYEECGFPLTRDDLAELVDFDKREDLPFITGMLGKYGGIDGVVSALKSNRERGLDDNLMAQEDVQFHVADQKLLASGDALAPKIVRKDDLGAELTARKVLFGNNKVPPPPPMTILGIILDTVMEDTILQILIVAAIVLLIFGLIENPSSGYIDGLAILIAVFLVLTITAANDYSKDRKFNRILLLASQKNVKVLRGGSVLSISSWDLVVGDVVILQAGDEVPGDGIFLRSGEPMPDVQTDEVEGNKTELKSTVNTVIGKAPPLLIDESPLTGETIPVKKTARKPFLFSGCQVSEGNGLMLITSVGPFSSAGKIQAILNEQQKTETTLQIKLQGLAIQIGYFGFFVSAITLIGMVVLLVRDIVSVGGWSTELHGHRIFEIVLVCVTVIVVAVPEGLPLAVTISLAFSVFKMIRDKCFVRHLNASETMGEATCICTDKTGTLTENRMTVTRILLPDLSVGGGKGKSSIVSSSSGNGSFGWELNVNGDNIVSLNGNINATTASSGGGKGPTSPLALNSSTLPNATSEEAEPEETTGLSSSINNNNNSSTVITGQAPVFSKLLSEAISCNSTCFVKWKENEKLPQFLGSATEGALLVLVQKLGHSYQWFRENSPKVLGGEAPFTSARKRMSTMVQSYISDSNNNTSNSNGNPTIRLYVKGASEIVLSLCKYLYNNNNSNNGNKSEMTESDRQAIFEKISEYSNSGLRTIIVAYREFKEVPPTLLESLNESESKPADNNNPDSNYGASNAVLLNSPASVTESLESDLIFLGMLGIKDPVRVEVPNAVAQCQKAGLTVRMVTGDNLFTASFIASECGILSRRSSTTDKGKVNGKADNGKAEKEKEKSSSPPSDISSPVSSSSFFPYLAIEGPVFRSLGEDEKIFVIPFLRVLARSSPSDKYDLVRLLQKTGQVVSVTGDGTNDAPALKEADVGFAMGQSGTQIARNASDIILLDDNFASFVRSIAWGRNVLDCVRKFLQFQLSVNVVAIIFVFLGNVIFDKPVLTVVQLLWINLIMDTLGASALASDEPDSDILDHSPHKRNGPLLTRPMIIYMIIVFIYETLLMLLVLLVFPPAFLGLPMIGSASGDDLVRLQTLAFNTFIFLQVANITCARQLEVSALSHLNPFKNFFRNPFFVIIVFVIVLVQVLVVQFGGGFTNTVALGGIEYAISVGVGLGLFVWVVVARASVWMAEIVLERIRNNRKVAVTTSATTNNSEVVRGSNGRRTSSVRKGSDESNNNNVDKRTRKSISATKAKGHDNMEKLEEYFADLVGADEFQAELLDICKEYEIFLFCRESNNGSGNNNVGGNNAFVALAAHSTPSNSNSESTTSMNNQSSNQGNNNIQSNNDPNQGNNNNGQPPLVYFLATALPPKNLNFKILHDPSISFNNSSGSGVGASASAASTGYPPLPTHANHTNNNESNVTFINGAETGSGSGTGGLHVKKGSHAGSHGSNKSRRNWNKVRSAAFFLTSYSKVTNETYERKSKPDESFILAVRKFRY